MWDRTVTISSAGKTFSVTGWKVRDLWICNTVIWYSAISSCTSCTWNVCLLAWLVGRTWALDKASSDRHAKHSVHLSNTFTGKSAQRSQLFFHHKECFHSVFNVNLLAASSGGRGTRFAPELWADGSAGVLLLLTGRRAGGQEGPHGCHRERGRHDSRHPGGRLLHAGGRHISQWVTEHLMWHHSHIQALLARSVDKYSLVPHFFCNLVFR